MCLHERRDWGNLVLREEIPSVNRDPHQDPQPGDVLLTREKDVFQVEGFYLRGVVERTPRRVSVLTGTLFENIPMIGGSPSWIPLSLWRVLSQLESSKILVRAEEELTGWNAVKLGFSRQMEKSHD